MNTMILCALVMAIGTVMTSVAGVVFKQAFDTWRKPAVVEAIESAPPPGEHAASGDQQAKAQVQSVQSIDQKGGVTAGYVESVNQGPPSR